MQGSDGKLSLNLDSVDQQEVEAKRIQLSPVVENQDEQSPAKQSKKPSDRKTPRGEKSSPHKKQPLSPNNKSKKRGKNNADNEGKDEDGNGLSKGQSGGNIKKGGIANAIARIEKIEKYLQDRWNWQNLPHQKQPRKSMPPT